MKTTKLLRDNIQLLKDGHFCYVYKFEQVQEIIDLFKQVTNNYCEIKVEKVDYFYRLTPEKQFRSK